MMATETHKQSSGAFDSDLQSSLVSDPDAVTASMRIGAIGRFGYGYLGDQLVLANLTAFLEGHRVIPIPLGFPNGMAAVSRLNSFDFLVLTGADLFRHKPPAPFDNFQHWSPYLNAPLGVLGVDFEKLSPLYRDSVVRLVERSEFFQVRNVQSELPIDHAKIQVAPDLTFYRPQRQPKGSDSLRDTICGVNLRPSTPKSEDWITAVRRLPVQTRGAPFSMHPDRLDRDEILEIDPFCPDIVGVEHFESFNFLIASDFYAIVLAIQTLTPLIAINSSRDIRRIMDAAGLGRFVLEPDEPGRLRDAFNEAQSDRDLIRSRMQAYTHAAQAELCQKLHHPKMVIQRIAETVARRRFASETPFNSKAAMESVSSRLTGRRRPVRRVRSTVGLIVDSTGATLAALRSTLESIGSQTYAVDCIVLINGDDAERMPQSIERKHSVKHLEVRGDRLTRLKTGLAELDCEFVSYVSAGCVFSEDALDLLIRELEESPKAHGAHSSYFLTREGIIERIVFLHGAPRPGFPRFTSPCLLVKRKWAQFVFTKAFRHAHRPLRRRLVYNQNPLFFKPTTEPESLIFRGILKFCGSDRVTGKRLIRQALATTSIRFSELLTDDMAAWFAGLARSAGPGTDPVQFVQRVVGALDPTDRRRLRRFLRRTEAHILAAQLFALEPGISRRPFLTNSVGILTRDLRWLRNPILWSVLLCGLVGRPQLARKNLIHRLSDTLVG